MRNKILLLSVFLILFSCQKQDKQEHYVPWKPENPTEKTISIEESTKLLIVTEQKHQRILLIDVPTKKIAWSWNAAEDGVPLNRAGWFDLPDEAKRIGDNILITASRGGVALIRVSDKKLLFYTNTGGNPHSAEVLPDGNIVVASSTGGNISVFKFNKQEPYVEAPAFKMKAKSAHNVVWDKKRECLWSAVWADLWKISYDSSKVSLTLEDAYAMDPVNTEAHDLSPVYGQDALYVTTNQKSYIFDVEKKTFEPMGAFIEGTIKSVSEGPNGYPTIITRPTTSSYWTTEVVDFNRNRIYFNPSYMIYKARWYVEQPFCR